MYAVIESSGQQFKVREGDIVRVDRTEGEVGTAINFDKVLMVAGDAGLTVGKPYVDGAIVAGEIVDQFRDKKVLVFKRKRRKGYQRKNGHRQHYTSVKVTSIKGA